MFSLRQWVSTNIGYAGRGWHDLHHNLETIKASGLGDLDLATESLYEVLVHESVRRGEECQYRGYEDAFIVVHTAVPVPGIGAHVNFVGGPER